MRRRYFLSLICVWLAGQIQAGSAEFLGSYEWASPGVGGISGLETNDGQSFWAVSDRGVVYGGQFVRDDQDRVAGVEIDIEQKILFFDYGVEVNLPHSDSEGLALSAEGELFVSFEQIPRVRGLKSEAFSTKWVPPHPDFPELQLNSALEALAIDADGALYTIPERSGALTKPFPVYRSLDKKIWEIPFGIPRDGDYLIVGADFGPDGRLFILERKFVGIWGFGTRVRAFGIGADSVTSQETVLETGLGVRDNLEGISVWRDVAGDIRITMVSDDNFNFLQKTEIVEYRLVD